MLVIRLSRQGRSKRPFYRVVLTEHTKPAQCGHLEVLGSYDPLKHIFEADVENIKMIQCSKNSIKKLREKVYQRKKNENNFWELIGEIV